MYDEDLIMEEKLEELMKKADELNDFIKRMKRKNRLADYARLRPLSTPRNIECDVPIFGFGHLYNSDAWNCFCKLAKILHENSDEYYMSTVNYFNERNFIRSNVFETFVCYGLDVERTPLFAVRYPKYKVGTQEFTTVFVYTDNEVITYKPCQLNALKLEEEARETHEWGEVPITEYSPDRYRDERI